MSRAYIQTLLSLALVTVLAACGGGGDGSGSPAPAPGPDGGTGNPPPVEAGFTLALSTDRTLVLQGNTATVTATVTRSGGFDGAVEVALSQLPEGVTANTAVIASGATSGSITLSALGTAPHSLPTTALVNGRVQEKTVTKPLSVTVGGPPGAMDTSFIGGRITTQVGTGEDYANAVVVQPDGKLIVAGSSALNTGTVVSLVRYGRDGELDITFGTGGKVTTAIGASNDVATALTLQPDGRIIVVGRADMGGDSTGYDFAVLRYNADGSPDISFGSNGKVVTDFHGGADVAHAVVLQPDGKIVVGGESMVAANTTGVDFALARYNSDGTLDAGFGSGGKLTTAMKSAAGSDVIRALGLQTVNAETRILAVGGDGDFLAARYTADGALDAGFAAAGKLVGVFNSNVGAANAVTVLPDGKAVLAGHRNHDFAMVQLLADGSLDAGFATAGKAVYPISTSNWDEATAVVRQADGKLIVGGWVYTSGSSGDFAVQRYAADGLPDDGFGEHSVVILPMAQGKLNDLAHGLVLQADERVPTVRAIQAGEANGSNHDFAITRYWL